MKDLKQLLKYLGAYRWDMVIGMLLIVVETAFELFIPMLMADLIDVGVANRDISYILNKGVQMGLCALFALITGLLYARFAARAAYGWDAELSIYLQPGLQRHRLGTRLYRALLALLHAQNVVSAYACITAPGPSIAFHETLGFQKVGTFPRTGWKFECWHDVVWMELPLRQRVTAPEPFVPFPDLSAELVRHILNDPI